MLLLIAALGACSDYKLNPSADVDAGVDDRPEDQPPTADSGGEPSCELSPPNPAAPAVDESCLVEPEIGSFDPVVEWTWTSNPTHPGYDDVMAAPAIADISGDGIPDIVFSTFSGGAYTAPGALVAISGDGSGTLWSVYAPGGYQVHGSAGVAIGDLEGDGALEICAAGYDIAVICLGADGSFRWAAGSEIDGYGAPSIADLDRDGLAEVIFGRQIFDDAGTQVGIGAYGQGGGRPFSFAIDADGDGDLEVIAGNAAYERDGLAIWSSGGADGYPAAADFDLDGLPEYVRVAGEVELLDTDGSSVWRASIPGGGNGGPPTVADFDGDGWPEVGVAAYDYYTVFDTDGSVLWSKPVQDHSSSMTGSSVFDFEGDGAFEVVYADEEDLWVFDGATGLVEMRVEDHSSGTLLEYPLIADVDSDGSTEIVVACNDYSRPGCNGIVVIGDAGDSWSAARPVWNQHAYHITNVENDGGIPIDQEPNWLTWNTFRAGGTELGLSSWLSDLRPGEPELCLAECGRDSVALYVTVENSGLYPVEGFSAGLYDGAGDRVWQDSHGRLDSGAADWMGPIELSAAQWGEGALQLVVDDTDAVAECDETDNTLSLGPWPCSD